MTRGAQPGPDIEGGLNTIVEVDGRSYHVQTQCSRRGDPVIESLVYLGGQTLIRFTSSFEDATGTRRFNADDGRHLIEHQHTNLIRKIRHGLLRGNDALDAGTAEAAPSDEPVRLIDADGNVVDPSQIDDPGVCELLQELGVAIDSAISGGKAPAPAPRADPSPRLARPPGPRPARPTPRAAAPAGPWWRWLAVRIRLRFR